MTTIFSSSIPQQEISSSNPIQLKQLAKLSQESQKQAKITQSTQLTQTKMTDKIVSKIQQPKLKSVFIQMNDGKKILSKSILSKSKIFQLIEFMGGGIRLNSFTKIKTDFDVVEFVEFVKSEYNKIKSNPELRVENTRFEIMDNTDMISGITTKSGYIVDTTNDDRTPIYNLTRPESATAIYNFSKTLNLITQ